MIELLERRVVKIELVLFHFAIVVASNSVQTQDNISELKCRENEEFINLESMSAVCQV